MHHTVHVLRNANPHRRDALSGSSSFGSCKKSSRTRSIVVVNPVVKLTGWETRNIAWKKYKVRTVLLPVTRSQARFNHLRFNNHRRPHRWGRIPPPCSASVHRRMSLPRSWESRSVPVNKLHRPKRISHLHRPDWHSVPNNNRFSGLI